MEARKQRKKINIITLLRIVERLAVARVALEALVLAGLGGLGVRVVIVLAGHEIFWKIRE